MALTVNILLLSALILAVQPLPQYSKLATADYNYFELTSIYFKYAGCPRSALQLITNADVSRIVSESSYTANIDDILSVSSYYWGAPVNNLPENATLIFAKPYVLIGLTSAGLNVSNDVTYVRTFSLSYSAALNGSFENLTQVDLCAKVLCIKIVFTVNWGKTIILKPI